MYDLDVVLDAHSDFHDVYIYVSAPSQPLDSPLHVASDGVPSTACIHISPWNIR